MVDYAPTYNCNMQLKILFKEGLKMKFEFRVKQPLEDF